MVSDHLPPPKPGERMQRVRVGVTGLAAVLLIVALATAIASGMRRSADAGNTVAPPPVVATVAVPANTASENTEPLAQLGAAPGTQAETPPEAAKQ